MRMHLTALLLSAAAIMSAQSSRQLPQLKVAPGGRYLVTGDGKPFFYLGDTAWELFHRLNREEATRYLENRAKKGYTVIQAVALAELEGLNDPNPYGHRPLVNNDPLKPDVKDGADNDYWDHVDFIVRKANSLGLYIGFLPTWGDKWNGRGKLPEVFTPENAQGYGEWIGKRYGASGVIWVLGGDRPVESDRHRAIIRAMAAGLKNGDSGRNLITYHPPGGAGSADHFHSDDWLSFNMRQNGHAVDFTGRYDKTLFDYKRTPVKPVMDAEPVYEDHPVAFRPDEQGHSIAVDVRRPLYWDLFSGAFGHTYGHHSVWQMYSEKRKPINRPLMSWDQAIDQPGAGQMQYGRRLMESRPFLTRVPDDEVIVPSTVTSSVPGAGRYRYVATRDESGSYAMVYAPVGRKFSVRMDKVTGPKVIGWWFNPRNGSATRIGTFENSGTREFTPPDAGEMLDWVLVLDSADKKFPPPGQVK
ncbi:MAG TPA: glycoside hydrolase family 140 protein [Bryobacteraceae bacterium]|nr:glycoside hydrolase family 140 protein [Bryobacteraceae bacterium]